MRTITHTALALALSVCGCGEESDPDYHVYGIRVFGAHKYGDICKAELKSQLTAWCAWYADQTGESVRDVLGDLRELQSITYVDLDSALAAGEYHMPVRRIYLLPLADQAAHVRQYVLWHELLHHHLYVGGVECGDCRHDSPLWDRLLDHWEFIRQKERT